MKRILRDQSGAALLTILLFVVIMLILVTTMLTVAGNESVISGLYRDSVRAKEIAEGGLSEGLQRLRRGNYFALNSGVECYDSDTTNDVYFTNSLTPDGSGQVRVCLQDAGAGGASAIWEIQSNATVGAARRRLSLIALQGVGDLLPNIVYGHDCSGGSNAAEIKTGDIYCQTFVKHKSAESAAKLTYGGWFITKLPGDQFGPCYTREDKPDGLTACKDKYPKWWPGHRRAFFRGTLIKDQLGQGNDQRTLNAVFYDADGNPAYTCPDGALQDKTLYDIDPTHPLAGLTVTDASVGGEWQATDRKQDNSGTMPSSERLYGCAKDGRPYTWVREAFDGDGTPVVAWFKTIEFEDWRNDYWIVCKAIGDPDPACDKPEEVGTFTKKKTLEDDPSLGAVPPFPDFDSLANNYNEKICQETGFGCDLVSAGGNLGADDADKINWGTCVEGSDGVANNCDGATSDPRVILLTVPGDGDYRINANIEAHGTILVGPNQDLEINGTFICWCTLIVDGKLILANGTVRIYGGLVAKNTSQISGNIDVYAGGSVSSVKVGGGPVDALSWWQR